jgi:phosphatidylglycerophosphate synthase
LTAGAAAQVFLLVVLTMFASLGPNGWITGVAYMVIGCAAIMTGLRRYETTSFGPADLVTLFRAVLIGGVTALLVDTSGTAEPVHVGPLVGLAAVALSLDAVDGQVARRTGTVSAFGGRFDMEVDAFLILVLSAYLATSLGPWVLVIGVMRYVFVIAGRLLAWMRADLPPSMLRKTVAATQGIVLAVAASDLLSAVGTVIVVGSALAVLVWSFTTDVVWLYRHRESAEVAEPETAKVPARSTRRRVLAWAATGGAVALVLFALVAPNQISHLTPVAFARIPVEGLVIVGLALLLPTRSRRAAAAVVGMGLGLMFVLKIVDMGFNEVLARPFDLVFDWSFIAPGVDYLGSQVGGFTATLAVVGAVLLIVGVLVLMTLAVMRLSRLMAERRSSATRTVAAFSVVWIVCAVLGVQVTEDTPVASRSAADTVFEEAKAVRAGLLDPEQFAKEASVDQFRYASGDELLTSLRGKDVVLNFIESYGRVSLDDPLVAPGVNKVLAAGNKDLRAAGYDSRSGYLTSSTFGGGSWLAHASLQSGLWINNQQRYDSLTSGDRLSFTQAFKRAGWRTVGASPQINQDWPEGEYFGYDQMYTADNVGYEGPQFTYSKMPDQYTLEHFQQTERAKPNRAPVMAELDLTSSHSPWAPLPTMVDWKDVGDGKVFEEATNGKKSKDIWPDQDKIKGAFGDSIEYCLNTLVSYIKTYGDENLVLIFLGDHQPAPVVSGEDASHDVPITIVAKDPAVLDKISGWGWKAGLNPGPNAPVWKMSEFRDKFLTAFGPKHSDAPLAAPAVR